MTERVQAAWALVEEVRAELEAARFEAYWQHSLYLEAERVAEAKALEVIQLERAAEEAEEEAARETTGVSE